MGDERESQRHVPCSDRPGGARLCRVRSSTDVHHAARMGWGVGGRARRGKVGNVGHDYGLVQQREEEGEERRGVAAPGLIARVTVCLWSGGVTHGRVINRMSDNSKSCKQWCVVLIAAIFAVVAKQNNSDFAVLLLFATIRYNYQKHTGG